MNLEYIGQDNLLNKLRETKPESIDFVVFLTGAVAEEVHRNINTYLDEIVRVLSKNALLFVQGEPEILPDIGVYLDQTLFFRYWIAMEAYLKEKHTGLPTTHAGLLLFSKSKNFDIAKARFPHQICRACNRSLRDWGGKAHLMNPDGVAFSDVWKFSNAGDNYSGLTPEALNAVFSLLGNGRDSGDQKHSEGSLFQYDQVVVSPSLQGIIAPCEGLHGNTTQAAEKRGSTKYQVSKDQFWLPGIITVPSKSPRANRSSEFPGWNVALHGDAIEILKTYPDNSIDLVFADPPYNLNKRYNNYEDELDRKAYLQWCNEWLDEYVRVLKPSGSLYILNLPHWGMYHAAYLNRHLYFQNWIVWDALSEPRGKLMPAHYALLFYTKHPTDFTFNYPALKELESRYYCLRASCVRNRKLRGENKKEPLTDIWWDIHRIKHRRDRDYHPCQLPDALMERIISLSTNPGDIVLDALAGTGTTAVVAARMRRRYVAIDIDDAYIKITQDKLAQIDENGRINRTSMPKGKSAYNKKKMQMELRYLAAKLGRLPTPEDVQEMSSYKIEAYLEAFPSWGKALKAAKLEINNGC